MKIKFMFRPEWVWVGMHALRNEPIIVVQIIPCCSIVFDWRKQ